MDAVFRYIVLRVGDHPTAEDLTQDVFLSVLRSIAGVKWQGHFRPYLLRSAHHRVARHWRTLGRRPKTYSLPEDGDDEQRRVPRSLVVDESAAIDIGRVIEAGRLFARFDELTDLQREVIALRFGLDLSVNETALVMGRSISGVKSLTRNALAACRRLIGEEEGTS